MRRKRASRDAAGADPGVEREGGAGEVAGAAADLNLTQARVAAQDQDSFVRKDLDPAAAVVVAPHNMVVADDVEADDLRAPQAAGEHAGDMAVGAVEDKTALGNVPGQADRRRSILATERAGALRFAGDCRRGLPVIRRQSLRPSNDADDA